MCLSTCNEGNEVRVKSLCLFKHHTVWTCEVVKVQLHIFLTSATVMSGQLYTPNAVCTENRPEYPVNMMLSRPWSQTEH